jgi:membrane protease YdiL (CAAX protease family)
MAMQVGLALLVNQVLFPSGVFDPVIRFSGGLISATLCANIVMIAVNLGLVVMLLGRLRPRDLGVCPGLRALCWSVAVVGGIWVCAQASIAIAALSAGDGVSIAPIWSSTEHAGHALGRILGQLFGNALYEESLFRGFLLVQVGVLLSTRSAARAGAGSTRTGAAPWIVAAALTQGFFALTHVPNRIMQGSYVSVSDILVDQGVLLGAGLMYTVIYLASRNLWLCILLHAFVNAPTPLLAGPGGARAGVNVIAAGTAVVVLVSIAVLIRRRTRAGGERV